MGVYPFDSADEVSLAMASDSTGDTFGVNRGMPVMLMADRDAPLALTVTMRKSSTDAVINTTMITNVSLPAEVGPNQVFAIPSIYLEPETQYALRTVGTVEGVPVDQTTHFTTGHRSHSASFAAGQSTGTLRAVYVYPADHPVSDEYQDAVQVAVEHLQGWYQQQLGGETFSIYRTQPEICALPQDSAYYYGDTWSKIQNDIQACVPARFGDPDYDWIIFADVDHGCTLGGNLDAGGDTLGMLQRRALEGLVGRDTGVDECARTHPVYPMARWIGLLAHEVGHTLGLPHPCNTYQPGCDTGSVMWQGSETYPAAYIAPPDRATLLSHRFINVQRFGR
jgi:hypothetical protein